MRSNPISSIIKKGGAEVKKKWMIYAGMAVVLILLFLHLVPMRPFGEKDVIEIDKVEQNVWLDTQGNAIEDVDITEKIDMDMLTLYLQIMQTKRVRSYMGTYWMGDVTYEIHGICNGKPLHINIGTESESFVYESSDKGGYQIKNPDVWVQIVELLKTKG